MSNTEPLFEEMSFVPKKPMVIPLAERVRPKRLSEVSGQGQLLGEGAPFFEFARQKKMPSLILWGNPGTGKTTIATLLASECGYNLTKLSAVDSGVREVRMVLENAQLDVRRGKKPALFIDEIHRFNKSQQDSLLGAVESGVISLIGATTENPSFELNPAIRSRCKIYRLNPLSDEDIREVVVSAIEADEEMREKLEGIGDWDALLSIAGGDARIALNAIEVAAAVAYRGQRLLLTAEHFEKALLQKLTYYDNKGETHYDTISAFIKSIRGSDPDAGLFWLAKMIEGGEDLRFIGRRLVILASEDIGMANPTALTLAVSAFQAVEVTGAPEAHLALAQATVALAVSPKSNAITVAIGCALADIRKGVEDGVPTHLKNNGSDKGEYKYPHGYEEHFIAQHYFPEGFTPKAYYQPTSKEEVTITERLRVLWGRV